MANDTNAANNSIPKTDADPKDLFDNFSSTASPPGGWYPGGIEASDTDLVTNAVDPIHAGFVPVVQDETNLPQSEQNPPMPARGSRLCDQPPGSSGRGGTTL